MTLELLTEPYDDALEDATACAQEIIAWLRENPNCHPNLRKTKLAALDDIEREYQMIRRQLVAVEARWLAQRKSCMVPMGEMLGELLQLGARVATDAPEE